MKNYFKLFASFLKANRTIVVTATISYSIFLLIFLLYSLPLEPFVYAALLSFIFMLLVAIKSFWTFYRKHKLLNKLRDNLIFSPLDFPDSTNLVELDYQQLIKVLDKARLDIINEKNMAFDDMVEYYTVWAHQIKTPIAAMRLLLQAEKCHKNSELLEQLFKIEQYVEMVLQYLRLENMNSDLLIKRYALDDLVKQAIRKYSKSFIRKRLKLNYDSLNRWVLTDEKWLVFVLEQILSNAIKYTNAGEVSKKLSHTIRIESEVGKGTKIKIGLDVLDMTVE